MDIHKITGRDPKGSCVGTDVCVHSPRSVNSCECVREKAHCCVVLFLQECGLVLVHMPNLECKYFKNFKSYGGTEGT